MYRIVIDQSTSASKALLFKADKIVSREDKKHEQIYPQENYVEHNPHEIISNVEFVIEEVIRNNGLKYTDIDSISITNQRETSVAWKKSSGRPIYNAIVWQCSRTKDYCKQQKNNTMLANKFTGLRIDNYFSAPKYNWIMNNVDEAKTLAGVDDLCLGTIESWLVYNLSEEKNHYTDITNSSRTLLMDINTNSWSSKLCELFEIPIKALPTIKLPNDLYGTYKGIKITGVIADSQAALYAQDLEPLTELKVTMGTGSSIMVNTGEDGSYRNLNVLTALYQNIDGKNQYALEGIIKSFGDTLEFVKSSLGTFEDYDQIFDYSFNPDKVNNITYIPGQYGLGCPYWEDEVGCQILNISRNSTKEDIAAAAIKSLGYQICAVIEEIETTLGTEIKKIKVDGGISKQQAFIQFISNLTGKEVEILAIEEASAFGALKTVINYQAPKNSLKNYKPQEINELELDLYQTWKQSIQLFIK